MGKLDHLKIKRCPAAFAGFARNFNQQVDLLGSIQGGPGIDVHVAHSPRKLATPKAGQPKPKEQPRGKILLTVRPSAVNGLGVGGGAFPNSNGTVQVVSADGTLFTVPFTANVGGYPTHLQCGSGNSRTIMEFQEVGWSLSDLSQYAILYNGGLALAANGKSFAVSFSDLTHSMTIREFTGCNSGSPGNYLTIASDFF